MGRCHETNSGVRMIKIADDIYILEVPTRFGLKMNVSIFITEAGIDTIDIGPNDNAALDEIKRGFQSINLNVKDIKNIYLTHAHEDHSGLSEYFHNNYGTHVHIHESDKIFYDFNRDSMRKLLINVADNLIKFGVQGQSINDIISYVSDDFPVHQNKFNVFSSLNNIDVTTIGNYIAQVVHTPGHTPGSTCFYLKKDKLLFSGDMVLPRITPNPGTIVLMEMMSKNMKCEQNPLKDFINSLQIIRNISVDTLIPGHGYTISMTDKLVDRYIRHHERTLNNIVDILGSNSLTCFELSKFIYRKIGNYDLLLQILEVEAHLRYLISLGKIQKIENGKDPFLYRVQNVSS